MKLFGLLIGITEYPINPLTQCVNDVEKVERYLSTLKVQYDEVNVRKLTNANATKAAIVDSMTTFLSKADSDDVALLYYSGHGAQEQTDGRFNDEHDGLLECIVAHYAHPDDTGYLLADKEIRFLLSKFKNDPHLVTIFDCCHSGDMVRSMNEDDEEKIKRVNGYFKARDYQEFIFSGEISEERLGNHHLSAIIPFKNHVHVAACGSSESSWENHGGGVFTNYLLQLLGATKGRINYQQITRWAKISLKNFTKTKQTPILSIQGEGKMTQLSSWLNLAPNGYPPEQTFIYYNKLKGWYLNRGALMGIKKGMNVTVFVKPEKFVSEVTEVDLEFAEISDPMEQGIEVDTSVSYPAQTDTVFVDLSLCINNLDRDSETEKMLQSWLEQIPNARLTNPREADYFLNVFNQTVYLTSREDPFRPLAEQLDLLDQSNLKLQVEDQIKHLVKWNHFDLLENPDFEQSPLSVQFRQSGKDAWQDIANSSVNVDPKNDRSATGELFQEYQISIKNITKEALFVGVLTLNSDLSITAKPFDHLVVKLNPGQSKMFYDHKDSIARCYFDHYKEIYNWKQEWFHYKFIVNNFEDFTVSLLDFLQEPAEPPLTLIEYVATLGEGGSNEFEEVKRKWGTVKCTIKLVNPTFNLITGQLAERWEQYTDHEIIAPFLSQLYLFKEEDGFQFKSRMNPNVTGAGQMNFWDIKINLANTLDNHLRLRAFKKARMRMPDKPVVMAEGDSWFLYPFLVKDTIDYVMEQFPVRSLAMAGDELEGYKKAGQLLKEAAIVRPSYVLISGGGNDIIGPEIVHILNEGVAPGQQPLQYLNDQFPVRISNLRALYEYFFTELKAHASIRQIFVHGYDFVLTDIAPRLIEKGWVNKYMIKKGILDVKDRQNVITFLVNAFNEALKELASHYPHVTYLDMRNLVPKNEWYDEIHPNDRGFKKVGDRFIAAIQKHHNKTKEHENLQKSTN